MDSRCLSKDIRSSVECEFVIIVVKNQTNLVWNRLDYDALDLKPLLPGALVQHGDEWYPVSDPFRAPLLAVRGLFSPVGSLTDKLRVLKLRSHLLSLSQEEVDALSDVTTLEYLQKFGFSAAMIERFFGPFYRGIFLAPLQHQSAAMFAFVFRQFATEPASLPAAGIGAVAQQLAKGVDVTLNSPVSAMSNRQVTFADGSVVECDNIVVATDGPTAARLVGVSTPPSRAVSCVYFTSNYPPPPAIDMPILCLNGTGTGSVNNMYVPTSLCPTWAPDGKTLISTTVLGSDVDESAVISQMASWFGKDVVDEWDVLKVYKIDHAQSAQEPPLFSHKTQLREGLFVCGDHRNTPTVNGALVSGREAANRVLECVKQRNQAANR